MITKTYHLKLNNHELRKNLYTGQWQFESESGDRWLFYFRLGRLIWCDGPAHWKDPLSRYVAHYCPEIQDKLEQEFTQDKCYFLIDLYQRQFFNKDLLSTIVSGMAQEFLFDIIQCSQTETILETQPSTEIPSSFPPLSEIDPILKAVEKSWQKWQNAGLANYSPNLYPIIQDESKIEPAWISMIDGSQTLRELAWNANQNLIDFTESLIPFIDDSAIALSETPQIKSDANQPEEANLVQSAPEQTVSLEVIVKQFRGNLYLQESLSYQTSIDEAKVFLQQGEIIHLIVNFQPQQKVNTTLVNQLFNRLLQTFQDWAEVEKISELQAGQLIIRLSPTSILTQRSFENHKDSILEKTIPLEVMVKQFRGSSYLQESLDYKTSIDQAQRLLQQGYTVTLMVTFQAQKNIDPTLANQLLNQVVQTFPNWIEVEQTSALQDRQMMIQLSPHKQEASI